MNIKELADSLNLNRIKIRGDEIHASCPFPERHEHGHDKKPSFAINVSKGVFNCFSCGSRGTIESLVSQLKGISISEAISYLDSIGFSALDRVLREQEKIESPSILPEGLLLYFDKVEDDFVEVYSGDIDDIDCLIYPVRDVDNNLVGAIARSVEGKWHKVLWNLHKSSYLYGENLVDREKPVVIVEGPGDVVSLRKSGINNAVALMGVLVSDEQIEKLLALSSEFIVWLDKDASGVKGVNLLIKKLDNRALVRYVDPWRHEEIEEKGDVKQVLEDYNSYKVKEILSKAKTFIEHVMEANCGDYY